jgi:hypothetical protein
MIGQIDRIVCSLKSHGDSLFSLSFKFVRLDSTFMWKPNNIVDQFRIRQWYALLILYYSTRGPSWTENWGTLGRRVPLLMGVMCLNQTVLESGITYNAVDGF